MNIDSIKNGYVLDHIEAGNSMKIYEHLNLADLDCSVAIIKNVNSKHSPSGKKDIIKIDKKIDINMEALGYIAPNITVNVIEDDKIIEKMHMELPKELKNIIKCKNPRCITSDEKDLDHIFNLTDKETATYRCKYCETAYNA